MKWYYGVGKLRYCNNSGWIVLDVPFSIIQYYSWWVKKLTWKNGSTPLHNGHITVVNGNFEDVRKSSSWNKYPGALIRFGYSNNIRTNENYYWLSVKCKRLEEIRKELGLKSQPKWPWHITVFYIQ